MTREELIEKVARAIAESAGFDWDAARSQEERDIFYCDARAALDLVVEACAEVAENTVAFHAFLPPKEEVARRIRLLKGEDND